MDRGPLSLVSNSNNSNNTSTNSNVIANKSLSPMSGPLLMSPPTFSRLPPDGHEFPPDFAEPLLLQSSNSSATVAVTLDTSAEASAMVRQTNGKSVAEATLKIR